MAQTWPITLFTEGEVIPVVGAPMERRSSLRVTIGDHDVTQAHNGLSWSNVARGGLEACQLQPSRALAIKPGDPVRIWLDNECVFWGDVNDPGDQAKMSQGQALVVGVGPGRVLKENPYREIYCDRDLGKWGDVNAARYNELQAGGHIQAGEWSTGFDDGSSPIPSNHTGPARIWRLFPKVFTTGAVYNYGESWYDSGGIPLGAIYYDYQSYDLAAGGVGFLGAAAAPWTALVRAANRTNTLSVATYYDETADLADGTGAKTGYLTVTDADRLWGILITRYLAGGAINTDGHWATQWRNLAVYGRHGLARRGPDPGGFYPHDIARDALKRVFNAGILPQLTEATTFILRHYLAENKTPEQVIEEMAKFMGWYWGVWAPSGFDVRPRLLFHPPRASASCSVRWQDCRDGEAPRTRLDLLYDQCRVTYQNPAGQTRYFTVSKANPFLDRTRRMEVSMAVANEADARLYGQFALALSQSAQRGSGWAILPEYVETQMGRRPSATLQAGRDRLRVVGLPLVSNMLDPDTRSTDTFHIQKVECSEQSDGSIQTRVEFDGGADLLDTLNVRAEEALMVRGA